MVLTLALLQLARFATPDRRPMLIGALCVGVGFLSISLTDHVVSQVFHKPPQLVPLMTARFIGDGPGADFIRAGCNGQDFAVCRTRVDTGSSDAFLWSKSPSPPGFLTVTAEQRDRMSAEDTAFALATLKAYPMRETGMIVYNSFAQMLTFGFDGLNTGCWSIPKCWSSLPNPTRDELQRSLSGRNLWPAHALTVILYASVALAVVIIAVALPGLRRSSPSLARKMMIWLTLGFVAMLACDVLGGAISAPQYRYQGRLVWLVILFAAIVVVANRQNRRAGAHLSQ
jgi:hypothetical protein